MQLKQLLTEDRAVSPVIGVILMVAITVILAAVIGTFVLGLGDQVSESAPQASFSFDFSSGGTNADVFDGEPGDNVTITHEGGETLEASNIGVEGSISSGGVTGGVANGNWPTTIEAGSSSEWEGVDAGETIRVIWTNPAGGATNTIAKATAPQ
ncbi:type IV pilin [Haloplanus natans]|uniref:type IV pilin n=1 Tax=Haloplanus natans TaxID=376171 RepID=UPI000677FE61|nr:type IV pilin N-terminal domain-containing protein [Haloplanus natans]